MDFIIEVLVDNAESINLTIDPNVVISTREYVEYYINQRLKQFEEEFEPYELEEISAQEAEGMFDE